MNSFAWQFVPHQPHGSLAPDGGNPGLNDIFAVGMEFAHYQLQMRQISLSSNIHFFYLPRSGYGAALLAYNLARIARTIFSNTPLIEVLLNWPVQWQTHLDKILQATPTALLVGSDSRIQEGSFSPPFNDKDPLYLLESVNPQRIFLYSLKKKNEKTPSVQSAQTAQTAQTSCLERFESRFAFECVGAQTHSASCFAEGIEQHLEEVLPSTSLLPNGLLSFLQARITAWQAYSHKNKSSMNSNDANRRLAQRIVQNSKQNRPTLVLLDEDAFLNLPTAVAELKEITDNDLDIQPKATVTAMHDAREIRQKKTNVYFAKIAPESLCQYASCNGFLSRSLWNELHTIYTEHADKDNTNTNQCDKNTVNGLLSGTPLERYISHVQASLQEACTHYSLWTKAEVSSTHKREVMRFMFKLAGSQERCFPNQFEMLLAAQSVVNSNLSFEWLKDCRSFPANSDSSAWLATLPTLELPLEWFCPQISSLTIQRFSTLAQFQQKPKLRSVKLRQQEVVRASQSEKQVDETKYADNSWVHENHPYSCSFPDEDFFMEDFCSTVRSQKRQLQQSKESRSFPLTSSLEDGLDFKETMRNLHLGEVYVKETLSLGQGDIGAIVFQFADSLHESKYTWQTLWQAEPHDDSHLLFFATPYEEQLIGPGIAKSEFGGFAVLPINSNPFDPWEHPQLQSICNSQSELLLLASALATHEPQVLFISDFPPSKNVVNLIKRSGKSILFQRLKDFSPEKIRKLKTFHILAEAGVRAYAHKYILKEL